MERKLVRQGRNALTVTLPAAWLKAKGLHAGRSVFIDDTGADLIVSAKGAASSRVSLDLRGMERSMIFHTVMAAYIEGFDHLEIRHDCLKHVSSIAQALIGMVIETQTSDVLVIKSIIVVPEDNFDAMLRRSAHMLVQQARLLVEIAASKASHEDLKDQELLLDMNLLYCLRYLTKYEHNGTFRQFLVCSTLELAADQITRIAKHIGKNKLLATLILKHIEEYAKFIFAQDLKKTYATLRSFRDAIPTKTYVDGLALSLAEILYNYIGFVVGEKNFKPLTGPQGMSQ